MKSEAKTCIHCGALFIPTDGRQKVCPDCRSGASLGYIKAKKPGEVKTYNIEDKEKPEEAPEIPAEKPQELQHGYPKDGWLWEGPPVSLLPDKTLFNTNQIKLAALEAIDAMIPEYDDGYDTTEINPAVFLERVVGVLAVLKKLEGPHGE